MERGFPRGKIPQAKGEAQSSSEGNKVDSLSESKRKIKLDNLFASSENAGTPTEPMPKRSKKNDLTFEDRKLIAGRKGARSTEDSFQVVPLTYESLASGTLSMGVVYQVKDSQVIVCLPGRSTGAVGATDISGPYTSYLENYRNSLDTGGGEKPVFMGLQKLFKIGQMVVVKVLSMNKRSDGKHNVKLSMKPEDIHGNFKASMVHKDLRLVGAIESKGENGYEVDVGINNVKAFLSFSEVEKGRDLEIGELVYCKVLKQTGEGKKNTRKVLQVTIRPDKVKAQTPSIDSTAINKDTLLPGMILDTLVTETNETGLKVSCGMLTGLVHCDYIKHEWADTSTVQVPSEHRATVLYVLPNITTPYFTMQTDLCPFRSVINEDVSKRGALVSARVQKVTSRGLLIHLTESNQRGLVTINHLGENFASKEDMAKKFKPKSGIECRVVSFSPFERMFICSLRKEIIESEIVDAHQAHPGIVLKCILTGSSRGGLEVSFGGGVKGFVPNSLMGKNNKKLKDDIEANKGRELIAKIMEVNSETQVILTLDKTLINSMEAVLADPSLAIEGITGHAVVMRVTNGGAVMKAIGGARGFIPLSKFKTSNTVKTLKCEDFVEIGQVVHYAVVKVENDQIIMGPYRSPDPNENETRNDSGFCEDQIKKCKRTRDLLGMKDDVETGEPKTKKRRRQKNKSKKSEPNTDSEDTTKGETVVAEEQTDDVKVEGNNEQHAPLEANAGLSTMDVVASNGNFWDGESSETITVSGNSKQAAPQTTTEEVCSVVNERKVPAKDSTLDSKTRDPVLKLVEEYEKSGVGAKPAKDASDGWYWVSLMKHYASSGNVEKARAVGREGLLYSPILQKSDSSLKIWRALLSLELKFGSEATAKKIISEAIAGTDDKYKCYQMAASVYQNENRIEDAINIYKFQLLKEFGGKVETWINFAKLYFHNGQVENARDVFHSACNKTASENLNGAELTSKFALLEIYHGDVAKGSMMFETLLASQPTRVDIWMVYVQALIKMKEYDRARAVFSRIFERDWKPTKVRSLLACYKTLENEHGDPSSKQNFLTAAVKVLGPSGLNVLGDVQQ